jgi:thiamine kinase-like enzyme
MICLSAYTVMEYLVWVRKNLTPTGVSNNFLNQLKKSIEAVKVNLPEKLSRNPVFELDINGNKYFLKQFRTDLTNRKEYFNQEKDILERRVLSFSPVLLYWDDLNQIIITENVNYDDSSVFDHIISLRRDPEKHHILFDLLSYLGESVSKIHTELNTFKLTVRKGSAADMFADILHNANTNIKDYIPSFMSTWNNNSFIHCDLKQDNTFYSEENKLKIIDWEMVREGDSYYDLSFFLTMICFAITDETFFRSNISSGRQKLLNKAFLAFTSGYSSAIEIEKLKLFMVVQNYHHYEEEHVYFNNIDKIFNVS